MYIGLDSEDEFVSINANDLTTHAVILGRTGSGKSGLVTVLVEEAATESGAGVIMFDLKGDLETIANRPTTDEEVYNLGGVPSEHWNALARFGYDDAHARHWRDSISIDLVSPRDVGVMPSFDVPAEVSHEIAAARVASALLLVRGQPKSDDLSDVGMSRAVLAHWERGIAFPMTEWAHYLTFSVFEDDFHTHYFTKTDRLRLAKQIVRYLHTMPNATAPSIDIESLAGSRRVLVVKLSHLNEDDQRSFIAATLNRVVDYMRTAAASDELRLLIVLDEARGLLPPYPASPTTKPPLMTLLAQGRSRGIGVVLGTQNPVDIDYKALSNVGTWFIGRLRDRDCERDLLAEFKRRGISVDVIQDQPVRGFVLIDRSGRQVHVAVRHALSFIGARTGGVSAA